MRPRSGDLLGCLVLTALVLGCFARLVVEPRGLIVDGERPSIDQTQRDDPRPVGNDVTFGLLPRFVHLTGSLDRTGRLPLWDTSGFGGRPLVGNPQGGLYYPPIWLAWRLGEPALLGWLTVGHLLWGGLGVLVLTRALGLSCWGATVAGGCFEAAPYLLAQTFEGHYAHIWAASWYPWAFWAFGQHRLGRTWACLVLALILALSLLTGHPQEGYYLIFALSLLALADAVAAGRAGAWRGAATGLIVWGGVLGLMLGLVAAELIPGIAAQEWALRSARMTLRQAGKYHLHSLNLFQLLGPSALGGPAEFFGDGNYWETVLSIGVVPLVLAAVAVARHPDRKLVGGWTTLTVLAVLFAAGPRLGVFPVLFEAVPGMNRFRVPARSLFLANLGAAVLAGLGVEALRPLAAEPWRRLERGFWWGAAVVVAGLVLIAAARGTLAGDTDAPPARPEPYEVRYGQAWSPPEGPSVERAGRAATRLLHSGLFWLAAGGTGALLFLGRSGPETPSGSRRGTRRRAVAVSLLGTLALVELGWHGQSLLKVVPAERILGSDPISSVLKTAALELPGPVRIRARDTLYPDIHAFVNGIEKININDGFQLQHAADLYETLYPLLYRSSPPDPDEPMSEAVAQFHREVRQAVLDRLNIALLVSEHIEPEPAWPLVATGSWNGSAFAIHRNPSAVPRAYVVPRAEPCGDDVATVLAQFRGSDPRRVVLMPHDPLGTDRTGPRQPFTPARWRCLASDRLELAVTTAAPGLLVIADTWMPGWTAVVDGRPAPILRGNHAQRVIALPTPGSHEVVLRYDAPGLSQGVTITGLALVAVAAALLSLLAKRVLRSRAEVLDSNRNSPGEKWFGRIAPVPPA
jgi:hypothetical protein